MCLVVHMHNNIHILYIVKHVHIYVMYTIFFVSLIIDVTFEQIQEKNTAHVL